ncbi:divalent metal cation transporter [Paenibacillus sp. FSL K6-3166]|uniref:divalent metal cation transporter n=1 Tax=Paenibacillus sp. FSL K6-3166 TaxID=2921492 RepID=UPI0030FD1702
MTMAAAIFYQTGNSQVANIESAFLILTPLLGSAATSAFLISLRASGISSSTAGQWPVKSSCTILWDLPSPFGYAMLFPCYLQLLLFRWDLIQHKL